MVLITPNATIGYINSVPQYIIVKINITVLKIFFFAPAGPMTKEMDLIPTRKNEGVNIRFMFCKVKRVARALFDSAPPINSEINEIIYSQADTLLSENFFSSSLTSPPKACLARRLKV